MSAVMNQSAASLELSDKQIKASAIRPDAVAIATAAPAPALEDRPLAGPVVTIRLGLTPGTIMLLAGPLAVLLVMGLGWVVLASLGLPRHVPEMIGGGIVNVVGGLLATLPVLFFMKKGVLAILQASMLAMVVRCGVILMGLMLALAPGWNLAKMPLVLWVLCLYFPLLIVETSCIAWLNNRAAR